MKSINLLTTNVEIDLEFFSRIYYFCSKLFTMGIAKVVGVIFTLLSFMWGTVLLFSYGSKIFDNATGGSRSLADVHLLIPIMICAIFFIFGNILMKDRIMEDEH